MLRVTSNARSAVDAFACPIMKAAAASIIVEPENVDEAIELVRKCERDGIALAPFGAARTLAQLRLAPVELGIALTRLNAHRCLRARRYDDHGRGRADVGGAQCARDH